MTPRRPTASFRVLAIGLGLTSLLSGCPAPAPADAPDAGADAATDAAADAAADGGTDASSGCARVTLGTWQLDFVDDVSANYVVPITEPISGATYALYLTFERYGDATYVGSFDIEGSRDDNRATCAHCVMAFSGLTRDHGFFAASGTMTLRSDPYGMVLDATLVDLRMIEVTIGGPTLMSTPVPGGACLEVADVDVDLAFPPPGWTCDAATYGDGADCQCRCGLLDPDCDGTREAVDCNASQICEIRRDIPSFAPFCAQRCSRVESRPCGNGVCAIDANEQEYCDPTPMARSGVALGQRCAVGSVYCAPVGTSFWDGLCDQLGRGDGICRPTCHTDAECDAAALERCYHLFGDTSVGHCAPRYPAAWTCDPTFYADGASCDCGCGPHDPDCDAAGSPLRGCDAGEVCARDLCVTPPANDTCATAAALAVGTPGSPVTTNGSTLGADDHYATQRDVGACIDVDLDGPDVVYAVTLAAGQSLDLVLHQPDLFLGLYVLGPGDATAACDATASHCVIGAQAADIGADITLHFAPTAAGTYFVVVDSFSELFQGAFTLDAAVSS